MRHAPLLWAFRASAGLGPGHVRTGLARTPAPELVPLARLQYGDLPTWVSAVASMCALIFAAIAAVAAIRVYKIESARDKIAAEETRRRDEQVRRGQAVLVSGWWGSDPHAGKPRPGAFIRNASDAPVYRVAISVLDPVTPESSVTLAVPVVPPAAAPGFYPVARTPQAPTAAEEEHRVEVSFTDAAGLRWIRDQWGRLSEVEPELWMWADFQRADALRQFATEFLDKHHVLLKFRTDRLEVLHDEFVRLGDGDEAPDVFVGSHDRIGDLVRHGAIEPIELSPQRAALFSELALKAMTYEGKLYGVPYGIDTICLVRNTDLAPDEPADLEEMIQTGRQLVEQGRATVPCTVQVGRGGGAYYIYPLFVSAGGWMFGRNADGSWDHTRVGFGTAESVAALGRLRDLGDRGSRVLRREIDRTEANELFAAGRSAFVLSTCRAVGEGRRAGIPLAISKVPPFRGGGPARSLTMVQGLFLSSRGRNRTLAHDLISDYMMRQDVALALNRVQPRPPALLSALAQVSADDAVMAAWYERCLDGDPMPAFPYNAGIWSAFNRAELDVLAGGSANVAARELADTVSRLVQTGHGR
jgi:arabinogalactan oligomer / maltooligosaccharide transport system substrate-binding protein